MFLSKRRYRNIFWRGCIISFLFVSTIVQIKAKNKFTNNIFIVFFFTSLHFFRVQFAILKAKSLKFNARLILINSGSLHKMFRIFRRIMKFSLKFKFTGDLLNGYTIMRRTKRNVHQSVFVS
jgi:hypothetical protein